MFNDFKPVLKILLRFVVLYVVMVLAYQFYLNQFKNTGLDPVSEWVANQAAFVQNFFGYHTQIVPGKPELSRFFQVVTFADEIPMAMPPSGHAISRPEIELLRAWIRAGAPVPEGRSLQLKPLGPLPRSI